MHPETHTDPLQSIPGANNWEIYNRTDALHGRPMKGMEGREIHGMHPGGRKKERSGLEGVGAINSKETAEGKGQSTRST